MVVIDVTASGVVVVLVVSVDFWASVVTVVVGLGVAVVEVVVVAAVLASTVVEALVVATGVVELDTSTCDSFFRPLTSTNISAAIDS